MRAIRLCILSLLLPLMDVAPVPVAAADPPLRLALIIANSTYKVLPPLPQCPPAARNMAAALKDAGFEVSEAYDLSNAAMNAALTSFARKASAQSVLMAYYCGYLTVFNDRPFLVPISAELVALNRIMTEGIAASALINVMIRAHPHQGLAILDVAPAPGKSDPVIGTTFPAADPPPPAVMLAISQPVPGGTWKCTGRTSAWYFGQSTNASGKRPRRLGRAAGDDGRLDSDAIRGFLPLQLRLPDAVA